MRGGQQQQEPATKSGREVAAWRQTRGWWVLSRVLLLAVILGLTAGVATLYLGRLSALPTPFVDELADAESIMRLLVIAPHPDDETIAAGGLIQQVLGRGGQVRVAILTNGDGSTSGTMLESRRLPQPVHYLQTGVTRQQESLRALALLGVPPEDVDFLGYPDQGIRALWSDYWNSGAIYRSPFTRMTSSIYPLTYNPESIYTGTSLLADLRSILVDFEPDTVVAPHLEDSHADHWAGGAFTALALALERDRQLPRLLLYLVHRGDFPVPRGNLQFAPLLPPLRVVNDSVYWQKVTLTDEVVGLKGDAVESYRSQLTLIGTFLRSFVRQNELFCELASPGALPLLPGQQAVPSPENWALPEDVELRAVLQDSVGDTLFQELGRSTDFVALYVGVTEDEVLVSAELRGGHSPVMRYRFLVVAADGDDPTSARVSYSTRFLPRPPQQAAGKYVMARFQLEEMGFPHTLVVSVESTYPRGPVVDRIGWAVVDLTPSETTERNDG